MNVTRTSILSAETNTLFIEGLTQDMLDAWHNGALIQEALAGIPLELREFVMTGVTPDEWNEKIGEEPEEDEWDDWDVSGEPLDEEHIMELLGNGALFLGQSIIEQEN
jgi:hypothetical protein